MTTSPAKASSLQLDPPSFHFDEGNPDLELFTLRMPINVSLDALKGVVLKWMSDDGGSGSGNEATTIFSSGGKEYRIQLGDVAEVESFRVLVPNDEDDKKKSKTNGQTTRDGDDDEDDTSSSSSSSSSSDDAENEDTNGASTNKGTLRPCIKGFSRHFQVLSHVPVLSEVEVAPREGPTPADPMRHAYAPVAQRTGLKRRWMPIGVAKLAQAKQPTVVKKRIKATSDAPVKQEPTGNGATVPVAAPSGAAPREKKRKREKDDSPDHSDDDDSSANNKTMSKSEHKAKKAEKKAAKKAKKEAKKAKKAKKEAKKSKNE